MVVVKRIAHTLEISIATHSRSADQAMRDERQAGIAQIPSSAERHIVQGLDNFSRQHPKAAVASLNGLSQIIGRVSYIGNGAFSSVYRKGDEVYKVYRNTAPLDESAKEAICAERATMCQNLHKYLGPLVAEQTLSVSDHPFGDYRVVMARQPFIAGKGLDLFATNTLNLNARNITDYCERRPAGQYQLANLIEATFDSDDGTGMVPDINGVDNFRITGPDESLVLVDAEPIDGRVHTQVHGHILKQAEILAAFLESA